MGSASGVGRSCLLLVIWAAVAHGQGNPALNQLDRFDPYSYPFALDPNRYQVKMRSEYFVTITYEGDWFGGDPNHPKYIDERYTPDPLDTQCPAGSVVMKIFYADAGVNSGWAGECPGSYHQLSGEPRPIPWPRRVCRSYVSDVTLEHAFCSSPNAKAITEDRCLGWAGCTHLPNTSNYGMYCPQYGLFTKTIAITIMCGAPVLYKVTPDKLPYNMHETDVYLTGPTGTAPGNFINVTHRYLVITVAGIEHTVVPTFISPRLLKFHPPQVLRTNENVTGTITMFYGDPNAPSNTLNFTLAAPVFHRLNQSSLNANSGGTLLLIGDYFVDTPTLRLRVSIEDGAVYYSNVTFMNQQELLLHMPAHIVPLHFFGLAANLEVAHHVDDNGSPYWQVVSTTVNEPSQALRVQYFNPDQYIPSDATYNLGFGIRSTSSIKNSWVHAAEFSRALDLGSTQLCRVKNGPNKTWVSDPLYEQPSGVFSQEASAIKPDSLFCFDVKRTPVVPVGGADIILKKYNSTRQLVWANRIGGPGNDDATGVTTDLIGNIFVAGNVYGPTRVTSKVLHFARDEFEDAVLLGSQTSLNVRRLVVVKYDEGGKKLWGTEIGACPQKSCYVDTISVTPEGYVFVTGSFYGTASFGLMCKSKHCQTTSFAANRGFRMTDRTCMQQGMESFNETCREPIPATIMKSGTVCMEPSSKSHLCYVDTFATMLDQNGTLMWAKNIVQDQTWMRYTAIVPQLTQRFVLPLERSAWLAYRGVGEKLASSTDPETTMLLLQDRSFDVKPIYYGLRDAYHIELQSNKTRLSPDVIQACIYGVNAAFQKIKETVLAGSLSFYFAVFARQAFLLELPESIRGHTNIAAPAKQLLLANAGGYQSRLYNIYASDTEFDILNRGSIVPGIETINSALDLLEPAVMSNDVGVIQRAISQPGLYFSGVFSTLLVYYSLRIAEMRKTTGKQLLHRDVQMIFLTEGTVISNYPSRPTSNDMQKGGKTLILKISGDEFKPLTDERKNVMIDNMVAADVFERGFETQIKPYLRSPEGLQSIVASPLSDQVTITFPFFGAANYSIPEPETVVVSIPPSLTKFGSAYPMFAEFVVRVDPKGEVWNTRNTSGDLYSRPIIDDLRLKNTTMEIFLAGDRFQELDDAKKLAIIDNMVPSGNDEGVPRYSWNEITLNDLRNNLDRLTREANGTKLAIQLRANKDFDLSTSETITVTIPAEVTEFRLTHEIGSFAIRSKIQGPLMTSLSANNFGSGGSWHFLFAIAGDRFMDPVSLECVQEMVDNIDSPDVPYTPNGFMLTGLPWMKQDIVNRAQRLFRVSVDRVRLQMYLPRSAEQGYGPLSRETLSFIVPAVCTQARKRHYYQPFYIMPGDGKSSAYVGESEARFLPENTMLY